MLGDSGRRSRPGVSRDAVPVPWLSDGEDVAVVLLHQAKGVQVRPWRDGPSAQTGIPQQHGCRKASTHAGDIRQRCVKISGLEPPCPMDRVRCTAACSSPVSSSASGSVAAARSEAMTSSGHATSLLVVLVLSGWRSLRCRLSLGEYGRARLALAQARHGRSLANPEGSVRLAAVTHSLVPGPEPAAGDPQTPGPAAATVSTAAPPQCARRTRLYKGGMVADEGFPAEKISALLAADAESVVWLDLHDPAAADLQIVVEEFGCTRWPWRTRCTTTSAPSSTATAPTCSRTCTRCGSTSNQVSCRPARSARSSPNEP